MLLVCNTVIVTFALSEWKLRVQVPTSNYNKLLAKEIMVLICLQIKMLVAYQSSSQISLTVGLKRLTILKARCLSIACLLCACRLRGLASFMGTYDWKCLTSVPLAMLSNFFTLEIQGKTSSLLKVIWLDISFSSCCFICLLNVTV